MGFYNNLTGDGVFFFWLAIVLSCLLVGLAIFLLLKNKKLSTLLKDEKKVVAYPVNKEDSVEIVKDDTHQVTQKIDEKPELLQIENKKEDFDGLEILQIEDKKENVPLISNEVVSNREEESDSKFKFSDDENEIPKLFEPSTEVKKVETSSNESPKPYQKNVLREMSKKMPISPIHIEKNNIDEEVSTYSVSNDEDYDLNEVYLEDDSVSPLEKMEDVYSTSNDNMKFASEVVSRMEEEMKPSNIELTDYEKKQEEEAIISYDELQKVKDKIYNITEDEETDEFIDELKNFRLDLQ